MQKELVEEGVELIDRVHNIIEGFNEDGSQEEEDLD